MLEAYVIPKHYLKQFMWTPSEDALVGRKGECINICVLDLVVLSIFMQQNYFYASNLNSSGRRNVGSLFTNEESRAHL